MLSVYTLEKISILLLLRNYANLLFDTIHYSCAKLKAF